MTESSLPEESILMQALEIPSAAERAAYLDRACGADRDLRAAVAALLRANDRSGDLLDLPEKRGGTIDEPAVSEHPGTVIGPYKLLQQIGEGGMGTVFMAEQAQPVQRKVALKIIKAGMDSHQVIARFEAERQALALMDHPNIARVLEAGTTNSGRPYFVMDLVKGVPITRYCDEHHLTVRERLELFVPVCQAIQHAHQKGIIHRDIKPSNVLVALYDGKPVPKVIDFGVAKAAGPKLTEKTLFTEFGQVVGTLEYMSPEQAELNQLDIDTRSDIYSLGVLLYELLTGTTPLERQRFKEVAFLEVLRLIREEESPRPSTRLSTSQELPSIAANRGLEPKKLNGLVRGELDWIVMKALEKDRSRRYETGNALARDVERYLHDEAVEACPPSARYRLRKFARKNRTALSVAVAFVLVLCGGVLVSTSQAIRAGKATERAENEARMAAAINDFLQNDLLRPVSNAEKGGPGLANPNLTVKEILDRAAARLGTVRFRDQPLVEAAIRYAIGQAYVDIGLPRLGVPHLERCWALRQRQLDPDHPLTLTTMTSLGTAYKAAGKFDQAVATFEQILARFRHNHQARWPIMGQLARAYEAAGKFDQAVALLQQRLTKDKAERPGNPETHYGMTELAFLYRDHGKYEQAEKLLLEMVAAKSIMWGADHDETFDSKHNLALIYHDQGKWDLAEKLVQEVIDAKNTNRGTDHDSILLSKNNLAVLYLEQGKYHLAETLMQEVLDASTTKLGANHPKTLGRMTSLARTYQEVGKLDKALPLFKQTLEKCKAILVPDHPDTLRSMHDLARAYLAAGKLDQALVLFEQTLQKCKVNLGPDHPLTLTTMNNLAMVYRAGGKFGQALPLLGQVLEKRKAKLRPDHPNTLNSMNNLATVYDDLGQFDKAEALWRQSLRLQKQKDPKALGTAFTLIYLGGNLIRQKKYAEAEPLFHEGLTISEKMQPDAWNTFYGKSLLGGALLGQKKYAEAEPLLLAGYEGMKQRQAKIPAENKVRLTEALERLVQFYEAWGQNANADTWRQKLQAQRDADKKTAKAKEK